MVKDPNASYPQNLPADLGETADLLRRLKEYNRLKVIPTGRSREYAQKSARSLGYGKVAAVLIHLQ